MPQNRVGLGIGLQSDLGFADRLWANDYNTKRAMAVNERKAKDLANQKQSEYINKFLNTANSGLHRVFQDEAKKKTAGLLMKMAANPDYARSSEGIQEFQNVVSFIDTAKQSTENAKKSAAFYMEHPNDIELDTKFNDILTNGTYQDLVKYNNGQDTIGLGQGFVAKPNLIEIGKSINSDPQIYYGTEPTVGNRKTYGNLEKLDIVTNVNPQYLAAKQDAAWESNRVAQAYFKGDKAAFIAALPKPTAKIDQHWGTIPQGKGMNIQFGLETNPTGNVAIEQVKNPDGSVDFAWTGTGLTTETNQVTIPTRYSTAVEDKGKVTDGYVIKGLQLKYFPEQNAVQFNGQYYDLKGRQIEIKDNQKIMYDLDNLNDEQVKILKNVSANTNNTLSFANGKPEVVGSKTSMLREYKVYDNKGKEAPAKTTQPKAATVSKASYVTSTGADVDLEGASEEDIQTAIKAGLIKVNAPKKQSSPPQTAKAKPISQTAPSQIEQVKQVSKDKGLGEYKEQLDVRGLPKIKNAKSDDEVLKELKNIFGADGENKGRVEFYKKGDFWTVYYSDDDNQTTIHNSEFPQRPPRKRGDRIKIIVK